MHMIRRSQQPIGYKVWAVLMSASLLSAIFWQPHIARCSPSQATARAVTQSTQLAATSFPSRQAARTDPEPQAVVPDIPTKKEVVQRTAFSRTERDTNGS